MREIKFRVPIECNACKFKGFQYFEWNGQSFTPDGYDKCECEKLEIIGDVQQFTGLKDKNGKEIYEGDIYHQGDKNILYKVIFKDCYFIGNQIGNESLAGLSHFIKDIEVIGNIFENPELINQILT